MKILCFTDYLGAGGAQRQLVGLASMLHQKGYKVKVCYYQDITFFNEYLEERGVEHELIPSASNHIKRIPAVARYFHQEKPDWVIAYQETPSLVATLAKGFGGHFRIIASERNTTQVIGYKDKVRFFLYRWADAIVPNSYAQGRFIKEHYPNLSDKISIITNYVDLEYFSVTKHKRKEKPVIVVAASIWQQKNTLNFINAVRLLKSYGIPFEIRWYGLLPKTTPYIEECKRKVEELCLNDVFQFFPKTKDIASVYQEADYFCLPSLYEGTPNVICEAMSSGLPIVCSNVCDNGLYVRERENGFLFNPSDAKNMANTILQMLSISNEEYERLCTNSRRLAEKLLSADSFMDKYLKLINSPS